MQDPSLFLRDLAIILTVAALTSVTFQRLRQPVVVGYILAGFLVGPGALTLVADIRTTETLAQLGVILLMSSIGLEFSLRRLLRLGPRVALVTTVEVGLMFVLGYTVAQPLGWAGLDRFLVGGIVAISSTMIIARVFAETRPARQLSDLVYGVLVMEDLVAILLIVVFTAMARGEAFTVRELGFELGRLVLFLAVLLIVGLLVVPRAIRFTVRLRRSETTLVATIGLCFLLALLAHMAGYSVALGAFVAGSLIHESGVSHHIDELIRPVRDMFAAIFFVAVGMLLVPEAVADHWPAILALSVVVWGGKIFGVTAGALVTGNSLNLSVRAGMTMAQIGEFSFILAGLGLTAHGSTGMLFPVAVGVSVVTALTTPWLARLSESAALALDRKLPKQLQTVVTLYGSWVELLGRPRAQTTTWQRTRRIVWLLLADAGIIAALIIGTSLAAERLAPEAATRLGLSVEMARVGVLLAGGVLAIPFGVGLVATARRLARTLAETAIPAVPAGKVDPALFPRRTLMVALELGMVIALGIPLVAITQPFVPRYGGAAVLAAFIILLAIGFWRNATSLQGHARAGAELIVHVLARQAAGASGPQANFATVEAMLPGMGTLVPVRVSPGSPAVGRTLGELNLRGLTGATVVALLRGEQRIVFPPARETLEEGDMVALSGSNEAIRAASRLLQPPEHA